MKMPFQLSYRLCLFAMFLLSSMAAWPQGTEAWVRRYDDPGAGSWDYARKVVTDPDGNVVVAGDTRGRNTGILIIKYSGAGIPLWTNGGPTNGFEMISDLAVDNWGNVFVAGTHIPGTRSHDSALVAYSGTGVPLWTNQYIMEPSSLAVDHNGNVFVTGYAFSDGLAGLATIGFSGAGVPLWTNRYDHVSSPGVAVDRNGNVFVTGSTGRDYATIAYSGAGVLLWTNHYNGRGNANGANAVAVDSSGNVFVTANSFGTGPGLYHDFVTVAYSGAGVPLWTNRYSGPDNSDDYATALAVDHNGNVFVTGYSGNDYATIAYSGAGIALWTNFFRGPTNSVNRANAVAVDNDGNVVVTGSSGQDYATIKYSGEGLALWTNRHDGLASTLDEASDVSVDSGGRVFVTGQSKGDFATIGYSAAGLALWTNRYDGPGISDDRASAIAVDHNSGNVLVTGAANSDYVTISYSEAGMVLWTNRYDGPGNSVDHGIAVAVDGRGNVVVTGDSEGGDSSTDYATIAYSASGVPLWTNRYNGLGNGVDRAIAVAVDRIGNAFVTGYATSEGTNYDYVTLAYSPAGIALWTNRYSGPDNLDDYATGLAVNHNGNVFVTGFSDGGSTNSEYATIAYSGTGVALWTNRYNGTGSSSDRATALVADRHGNVFVTGSSFNPGQSFFGYATIAYSPAGIALWTNRYAGPEFGGTATAIAVDGSGNVFVTGHSDGIGTIRDYATIAYSGAGVPLWTNRYNGTDNRVDEAYAVAVDNSGYVFVTGYSSVADFSYDYVTIAYLASGAPLWTNRYNGPANGEDRPGLGSSLAVGRDGAVYVTGSSDEFRYGAISDYATIKYVWRPYIAIQPLTLGSSSVNLNLSAPPNSSWSILRAPAITGSWTDLGVLLTGTNGSAQFTDPNSLANGAFYRVAPP